MDVFLQKINQFYLTSHEFEHFLDPRPLLNLFPALVVKTTSRIHCKPGHVLGYFLGFSICLDMFLVNVQPKGIGTLPFLLLLGEEDSRMNETTVATLNLQGTAENLKRWPSQELSMYIILPDPWPFQWRPVSVQQDIITFLT